METSSICLLPIPRLVFTVLVVCAAYAKLYATGAFDTMSLSTDEGEHSIEMHLPYIAKIMER